MNIKYKLLISFICLILPILAMGQGQPYEGPEDPAGDPAMEREGFMNGNRFRMLFNNNTQLADYPRRDASKWPDDYSGTKLLDVCCVEIGAEVYLTQDTIPVTDRSEVARLAALGEIDTLFFIQTQDYQGGGHILDENWNGTVEWALSPVPGYINLAQDYSAMSNKPNSWPIEGWPSRGFDTKWQGEWFGRYGRGLVSADLECYFVANDAQDLEYIIDRDSGADELFRTEGPRYYPRGKSDIYIGDFARPGFDATTQVGRPWGGLGLRVAVRGYQWNNPETRDIIFWEYDIANISDYDLPSTGFGYFIDPSIGGDTAGDGERSYFDELIDLTYIWEELGIGGGGLPTGTFGMAFLETPGNSSDNIDNDADGLIDERRDNPAGNIIGPTDGIDNMERFLAFYDYTEADLREHFEGDEDQDWFDGVDLNGNGTYSFFEEGVGWQLEPGEDAGDDVGLDGVSPSDLNYTGPDEGECNHMPDYRLGIGSEPNFNAQDVSEADQIGLTSQKICTGAEWQPLKHDQDENIWKVMTSGEFFNSFLSTTYIFEFFASATFPLYQGKVERISIAMIAAYDDIDVLNSTFEAPNLFKKKKNAQVIYERDYRFAQPPLMPTLKAYPGDGKVTLVWDDASDKFTREPLLRRTNDFEGYKLYRSTDKYFQDPEYITNAQGIASFKKPIFQCDKTDGILGYSTTGIHNVGREGTAFYLGNDTGLSHSYVDNNLENGRTYYYALVAYDYGIEEFQISPAENEPDYDIDSDTEEIIRMGKNVQVAIPRSLAAGYIAPEITIDEERTSRSFTAGEVVPEVLLPSAVKGGHTYRVTFSADTMGSYRRPGTPTFHVKDGAFSTDGISVYDITDGEKLVYQEWREDSPRNNVINRSSLWEEEATGFTWDYYVYRDGDLVTDIFDGIQITMNVTPKDTAWIDMANSGWETGNSLMTVVQGSVSKFFPWDYDIVFTEGISTEGTKSKTGGYRDYNNDFVPKNLLITDHQYNFYVVNNNAVDENGEPLKLDLIVQDMDTNGVYNWQKDLIVAGYSVEHPAAGLNWGGSVFAIDFTNIADESGLPKPGDVYHVTFVRPKSQFDSFVFTVSKPADVDQDLLKETMKDIKVVPNPYIATNSMEGAVANQYLNQGRRIMFTHLPAQCVIRIFTPTGLLVDTIEVSNDADDGIAHWDLLTKEDLEIASGMYVYQVEDNLTGHQKIGRFAVIK